MKLHNSAEHETRPARGGSRRRGETVPDDEPRRGGSDTPAKPRPRRATRSAKRARKAAAKRRGAERAAPGDGAAASAGGRRTARTRSREHPVDHVSRFSASALRRVTVLGDRPEQVVYSLAEQSRQKHGTYVLIVLLVLAVLALLGLLAALIMQLANPAVGSADDPAPIVEPPPGHSTLRPELFHAQRQQDIFAPIAQRPDGAEPLTEERVFADVEELSMGGMELTLRESEATDTCTALVWGEGLAQSLSEGSCASAARGVYQDSDGQYVAQFTLFDLADADAASGTLDSLDPEAVPAGFVLPMKEDIDGLHRGYSQATAQAMGHYVAVFWVARADGAEPSGDDSMATLNVAAMDAALVVYEQVRDAEEED